MAIISFSENSSKAAWAVAGWAFRQLLVDVLALHPDDPEMASKFDEAKAVGFLRLGYLNKPLAMRLATAIRETAAGILAGKTQSQIVSHFKDQETMQEYLKGLRMLLDAVEFAESGRLEDTPFRS